MKLRGKLILSFCSVVLIILAVFGVITYMSFSGGFRQGAQEFYNAKVNEIALSIDRQIQTAFRDATLKIYPDFLAIKREPPERTPSSSFSCENFSAAAKEAPLFSSVFLADVSPDQENIELFCQPETLSASDLFSAKDLHALGTQAVGLHRVGEVNYLIWSIAPSGGKQPSSSKVPVQRQHTSYLIAAFESDKLKEQSLSRLEPGRGYLFVALGPHLLFHSGEEGEDFVRIKEQLLQKHTLADDAPESNLLIFKAPTRSVGLDISYVVPQAIFLENLLTLKNRIIAASLLLGWVAVWVVLILAYRISRPIVSLARVSNDMIKFNYTSPMDIKPSNDEIGDLARSFETMRQEIERHVTLDPLTKTHNRRYLMYVFGREVERALRFEQSLACIMLDIDYFKKINDTYGHQAGDEVLAELGQLLMEGTRKYDVVATDMVGTVARYGGEEFTILLPNSDLKAARDVAERLRANIAAHTMSNSLHCTISLGVAALTPLRYESPEELIKKADTALYEAKERGRNTVVCFDEKMG